MHVGLSVHRHAIATPDADALIGERTVSYGALEARTNQIANALLSRGVGRGERVALMVANRPEVVEVLVGVAKAGAVYVGLNFRLGDTELTHILGNAEPVLMLVDEEHLEQAQGVTAGLGIPTLSIESAPWRDDVGVQSTEPPQTLHEVRPDDDFCIVYTSGTTGRPKGVLFDHARSAHHGLTTCLEYEIDSSSRYLIQIPHNSSVNITIVPCLMAGAALGFRDSRSYEPVAFAREVEHLGITHTFLVPTQLMRLLDRLPRSSDSMLAGLKTLGYGSSPISPARLGELIERFGPIFNQLYGMAEIASIGTILSKEDHVLALGPRPELLQSCGRSSFLIDVRVVDEQGRDVAPGERGEVVFAGSYVMKGYFREPDRTGEVLIDGWMHSGDVAEVSEDGYFFIVDRIKNLIIRGGLNIAPTEIENVLYRHPGVLEASVVGVPDPEWGEAIVAVVVAKDGAEIDPDEVRTHCRMSELSSFKVPERVLVVDALPKNAVGKIQKDVVRSQFWGEGRRV